MREPQGNTTVRPHVTEIAWLVAVAIVIATGIYVQTRAQGFAPPGPRAFPRLPAPPADFATWLRQLGVGSVMWYAAALGVPLLRWGARQLDPRRRARATVAVSITLLALVVTTAAIDYFLSFRGAPFRPSPLAWLPLAMRTVVLPWLALASVVASLEWRRRARVSLLERERLRAQVAEQRLVALTGQLHPHFLFNTLQGISALIHRDPRAADEMLTKLADLLRDLLRDRERLLIPLGEELRYLRTYLEIAQLRFAERLSFAIDVPESLCDIQVPLFILQPLVENALAHGIGGRLAGGQIAISARTEGDRLILTVEDDGAGLPHGRTRERLGLGNTRERLRAAFGDAQRLTLAPRDGGGTVTRLELPA